MTGNQNARLLDCGWCYEEQGEAVHPHPECPVGQVVVPAAAPVTVPPADRAGLRERIADAIRAAACPGDACPLTETECAEQRIQPGAWERGVLSEVSGRPEWFADAVLTVLFGPIPADIDTATWTAIRAIQLMNEAGRQRDAALAVLPSDGRAGVLLEAADTVEAMNEGCGQVKPCASCDAREDAADALRDIARRMAAEERDEQQAQQDGPGTRPARGDEFEQWLKAQRDAAADYPEAYQATDGLLDLYRLHADTGTPLSEHVCEGRVVGDCECLEPHLTPSGNVRVDHLLRGPAAAVAGQPPADTTGEEA